MLKSREDFRALRKNNVGGLITLFIKNISKLIQFIKEGLLKCTQ